MKRTPDPDLIGFLSLIVVIVPCLIMAFVSPPNIEPAPPTNTAVQIIDSVTTQTDDLPVITQVIDLPVTASSVDLPITDGITDPPAVATSVPEPGYTDEELEILALIIYQEAGADYCQDSTRQMVGEVFLNRVASSRYPNTFYDVATQAYQYGRLHWVGITWPERASLPQEQRAVKRAYSIAEALLTNSIDRLLPLDAIYQAEFTQGSEVLASQDGLYFCR